MYHLRNGVHSLYQKLSYLRLLQAAVKCLGDGGFVHVLADEDEFLHTVAVLLVPIVLQLRVVGLHALQLLRRHCGKPLARFLQAELPPRLLKQVTHVVFIGEIAHAFRTNHILGPLCGYELIEQPQVERSAGKIHKCADAVFLRFTLSVVVMMMVVMLVMVFQGGAVSRPHHSTTEASQSKPSSLTIRLAAKDVIGEAVVYQQIGTYSLPEGKTQEVKETTRSFRPGRNFTLTLQYQF